MMSRLLLLAVLAQLAVSIALLIELTGNNDDIAAGASERDVGSSFPHAEAAGNHEALMQHVDARFEQLSEQLRAAISSDRDRGAALALADGPSDSAPHSTAAHAQISSLRAQRLYEDARSSLSQAIAMHSVNAHDASALLVEIDQLPPEQRLELMELFAQAVNRRELIVEGVPFSSGATQ